MFLTGTRLYVYNSSIKPGKTGPRKHSIGYVAQQAATPFVAGINGCSLSGLTFILAPLVVVFSRYGLEKSGRCEKRTINAVIPFNISSKKNCSIDIMMKVLLGRELQKNTAWYDWSADVAVVAPINAGPYSNSDSDKEARLTALLTDDRLKRYVYRYGEFASIELSNRPDKLHDLLPPNIMEILSDKLEKNRLIALAIRKDSVLKELLRGLCMVNSSLNKFAMHSARRYIESYCESNKISHYASFQNSLLLGMFEAPGENDYKIAIANEIINKRKVMGEYAEILLGEMKVIRDTYLSLEPQRV
jgi:hypothetical protein